MTTTNTDDDDFSSEGEEERATYRRRLFTYSSKALERGLAAERIYVNHPSFRAALEALDRIYLLGSKSSVPHGLRIVGDTGTGKSSVLRYFGDAMPPSPTFELATGALIVRLQERPNVGRVVSSLLRQLRYPFAQVSRNTISMKRDVLVDAAKQKGTRLVMVDEAHHLCQTRRAGRDQHDGSDVTELLRELIDECRVGLVLSGTKALDQLHLVDSHLHARTTTRVELRNFDSLPVFTGFMKAFANQCETFNLSALLEPAMAGMWHLACAGNPRAFKRLAVEAILVGVDAGVTVLDAKCCMLAFARVAGRDSLSANPFQGEAP
jgi:type II secretory pathway predicted ATPase ExeA